MVMTRGPLSEMVPIENASMPDRTVIEWDKDDIDAVGILKVDVLALGMLTCISKAFKMINTLEARNPKPEIRINDECSNPNDECGAAIRHSRHSDLVIDSDFGFRVS